MAKEKEFEFSEDEFDEVEEENTAEEKKKEKKQKAQVPVFLELVYSFSLVFTILLALIVAGISYLSGATLLDVFVRTAITILSTGLLLWIISLTVSNGAVKTVKVLQKESLEKQVNQFKKDQGSEDNEFSNQSSNTDVGYSKDE